MGKYAYPHDSKWPVSYVGGIWRTFGSAPGGVNPYGGHTGEDRAVPIGTPVYAPADGYIEFEQFWLTLDGSDNKWLMTAGGGLTVGVQADGGPLFIVAHLSKTLVNRGQRVRKGQLIALSGNSGMWTTGPHSHFEVIPPRPNYNNGTYGRVNPALYCTEYPDQAREASLGPAGTITTTPQEDEMPDMHTFLNHPAYTGGPTISELFVDVKAACKKVDAIHEAIFNNEGTNKSIIGGESLPSLTNKNDLKILERLEDVMAAIEGKG